MRQQKARRTTKADETPEFQAFWSLWQPHARPTDGRGDARDEFTRHVEVYGEDPQDIVDGAAWFLRTLPKAEREFIPLAASWLNKRAYEDGCLKEREFQRRQQEKTSEAANSQTVIRLPSNHFMNRYSAS